MAARPPPVTTALLICTSLTTCRAHIDITEPIPRPPRPPTAALQAPRRSCCQCPRVPSPTGMSLLGEHDLLRPLAVLNRLVSEHDLPRATLLAVRVPLGARTCRILVAASICYPYPLSRPSWGIHASKRARRGLMEKVGDPARPNNKPSVVPSQSWRRIGGMQYIASTSRSRRNTWPRPLVHNLVSIHSRRIRGRRHEHSPHLTDLLTVPRTRRLAIYAWAMMEKEQAHAVVKVELGVQVACYAFARHERRPLQVACMFMGRHLRNSSVVSKTITWGTKPPCYTSPPVFVIVHEPSTNPFGRVYGKGGSAQKHQHHTTPRHTTTKHP